MVLKSWKKVLVPAAAVTTLGLCLTSLLHASDFDAYHGNKGEIKAPNLKSTTEYLLLRVSSTADVDTAYDKLVAVGKGKDDADTLAISTGLQATDLPNCASECTSSPCDNSMAVGNDTNYPTSSTYYGGFAMILHSQNGKPLRFPQNVYVKSSTAVTSFPKPGSKLGTFALLDSGNAVGKCAEEVTVTKAGGKKATETWTFFKYSAELN